MPALATETPHFQVFVSQWTSESIVFKTSTSVICLTWLFTCEILFNQLTMSIGFAIETELLHGSVTETEIVSVDEDVAYCKTM